MALSDRKLDAGVATALGQCEVRLVESQRLGRVGSWAWEIERRAFEATPELCRILGVAAEKRADPMRFERLVHVDDRAPVRAHLTAQVAARAPFASCEFRISSASRRARWVVLRAAMRYDANGRVTSAQGTLQDVTERRELEDRLRRAQRMETLGQLAAGVAHEFNNQLTVIQVELDLLQRCLADPDSPHAEVLEIRKAAARAASLTRQLHAFGPKQILRPRVVSLNDVVDETSTILRRLIGEDIALALTLDADLPLTLGDPGQLQQVLIRLAVNARDAMPNGGTLSVSTSSATIGDGDPQLSAGVHCVITAVEQTEGSGGADRQRVAESFFTTKVVGTRARLGLSTLVGIVEQMGGRFFMSSEVDRGATFMIYMPSLDDSGGGTTSAATATSGARGPCQQAATVLLVEDEAMVRSAAKRTLEASGYTVLSAGDGLEAISVAERFEGTIDLLVTDIVLPGFSGREIAERLLRRQRVLQVLYMTGYTESEIVRRGLLDQGMHILEKPFSATTLVDAVCALVAPPRRWSPRHV